MLNTCTFAARYTVSVSYYCILRYRILTASSTVILVVAGGWASQLSICLVHELMKHLTELRINSQQMNSPLCHEEIFGGGVESRTALVINCMQI